MPEGPEIRREADLIAQSLAGHTLGRVEFGLPGMKQAEKVLTGATLIAVSPRGKAMLIHFSNGHTLYSHNQLYGRWAVHHAGDHSLPGLQIRVALHARHAVAVLYSASEIALLKTPCVSEHPYVRKLGVELLDPSTTVADIRHQLDQQRFSRKRLGDLLLDQQFLSGLGNYLRSDILHAAKLGANIRLGQLADEEKDRLARESHRLTWQSYRTAGITNDLTLARAMQAAGETFEQSRFRVFAREGLPCHTCGHVIQRSEVTGRGWFFCATCQRLG